ncbi:MAG: hypothetical protein KatS3mg105_2382 [Gemmatales bacterium]|nr:MAG: hypothetical protein KatS3mg105_2382 [Gemmatales bacterium]
MCNTHGRRVNNDVPVRSGSGYVIRHNPDFLFANNAWFRGVDLKYGPDGGVYISDWTDLGECHDHDGVHRSSGRIYKVTFGKAAKPAIRDVSRLSDAELVQLQLHKNDWYVRHARRLLQERAAAGKLEPAIRQSLFAMFDEHKDVTRKLRALWCLYVTESLSPEWLQKQLRHPDEHVRLWAVRLLVDGDKVPRRAIEMFVDLARTDSSKLVRLFLASALQRLPIEERFALAAVLVAKREDADDHNLPLMIWYGIEPLVAKDSKAAVGLFTKCRMPLVRRYIARRLSETLADSTKALDELLSAAAGFPEPAQVDLLEGMDEALQGWRKAEPPKNWEALRARLETSSNPKVQKLVRSLSVVFGDGRALNELIELVNRQSADADARREALRILIQNRPKGLREILLRNLSDRALVGVAVQGLAAYDDPAVPKQILQHYRYLRKEDRPGAISTLVSRPHYAEALLKAVADGRIDRTDISAFHARQIQRFNRKSLNDLLTKVWGELRSTSAEKKKLIARYRDLLNQEALAKADRSHGRLVFKKVCAVCHTLYGEGNTIGPDLTGSNRDNLDYLLENIVDPSASVAADFKMSFVLLKSGRALSGVIGRKTDRILELQTQNEKLVIPLAEIDEIQPTPASLMPEGLFASLKEDEIRDLIAYLMSKRQVPLPEASRQD